jgi:hypothetical protein
LKKYVIVAALIASASVYADPIYLECSLLDEENDNGREDIEVRLDESNGKVSHSTNKLVFNADGIWSADAIRYKYVSGGEYLVPLIIQEIQINRSTLKMTKTITIEYPEKLNMPDDLIGPWSGDCRIVETRQNKI